MKEWADKLQVGDRRSLLYVDEAIKDVTDQPTFDALFELVTHPDRKVAMRAIDAVEKITLSKPVYLYAHHKAIVTLCQQAEAIEIKWHVAQLLTRLPLSEEEVGVVWDVLTKWTLNRAESRIVRANALQTLVVFSEQYPALHEDLMQTIRAIENESIPSLQARLRQLKKRINRTKSS